MRQTLHLAGGIQHRSHRQIDQSAHGAHQVDDSIGLTAQGLCRHIGHQRHRRRAVSTHSHQQQTQHHDKGHQLKGHGFLGIAVIQHRQQIHQNHCHRRARQDKGSTPTQLGLLHPVGETAEQRQQKQRQHIVRRHDHTGQSLVHAKGSLQHQRDHVVVHLPESTDGQKGQTYQHRSLVVKLHTYVPLLETDSSQQGVYFAQIPADLGGFFFAFFRILQRAFTAEHQHTVDAGI